MAILGPGLPATDLPEFLLSDDSIGTGGLLIHPTPPQHFFEPFSRTSYWRRQRQYVDNLQQGTYMVAVWHESPGQIGRYVLVFVGREVRGGDPQFASKIKEY